MMMIIYFVVMMMTPTFDDNDRSVPACSMDHETLNDDDDIGCDNTAHCDYDDKSVLTSSMRFEMMKNTMIMMMTMTLLLS